LRWRSRFRIAGVASREVFRFHGLDKLVGLEREDPGAPGLHAIAIRLAQPFDLHHVNVLESLAPINVYAMLDTIAEDCAPLSVEREFLPLWDYVARHANGLLFISRFSESSFCIRHPAANDLPRMAQLLSTTLDEYRADPVPTPANSHVLVLGNHFPHKGSLKAGSRLAHAHPTIEFVVIGGENARDRNVTVLKSGTIEAKRMDRLIREAAVVVLPAHVEGFGFGFMHALAAAKPIVARRIPATEQILSTLSNVEGVFLFDTDAELLAAFQRAMTAERSAARDDRAVSWADWADGLAELCLRLCEAHDIFPRLVGRIGAGDLLRRAAVVSEQPTVFIPLPADPPPPSPRTQTLELLELLALEGRAFVEAAYSILLCRGADASGLAFYLSEIESGVDKREVIRALATSPEGRAKGVQLDGLAEMIAPPSPARKSLFARFLRH
jgi:glycosyltransferase involved in cell wall biosynthesis